MPGLSMLAATLIQAAAPDAAGQAQLAMDDYRTQTSARIRCASSSDGDEIVICSRRRADDFRVPLIGYEPGDPRIVDAWGERTRALQLPNNCERMSIFLVGCGAAGVSFSTAGGFGTGMTPRERAP